MNAATITLEWTLGDRLAKSRRAAGISSQDMADRFGVNRHTIGRWESDQTIPGKAVLIVWAQITGAPFEWIVGEAAPRRRARRTPSDVPKSSSGWRLNLGHMRAIPLAA